MPFLLTSTDRRAVHFVPNSFLFWDDPRFATTTLPPDCTTQSCTPLPCTGPECQPVPAYADVLLQSSNFVPCRGGPFALCYYSGPPPAAGSGGPDLSCTLTEDGRFANCNCYEIAHGAYFVDINAILNYGVYLETVRKCGSDGSACSMTNSAPVCGVVNAGRLIPGADLVSTFSFDCLATDAIGQTDCSLAPAPYAGCMTAPCYRTATPGIVQCSCPVFDGPYQIGLNDQSCSLGDDLVWSAAFSPMATTFPTPPSCVPDAPGSSGCPLLPRDTADWPSAAGLDCAAVCDAYRCAPSGEIEPGFTCDATLCTDACNDQALVKEACGGLSTCPQDGLLEIIKVEEAAHCSCCASQLCGCAPTPQTNAAISELNRRQRQLGITPQCDVNDTLCGIQP